MTVAGLTGDQLAIVGLVITLWIASLGAAWKIASLLASITSALTSIKEEAAAAKVRSGINAQNISTIQRRFDIPQATPTSAVEEIANVG